jgi:hypothetical protein
MVSQQEEHRKGRPTKAERLKEGEWLRLSEASVVAHVSVPVLYQWINAGWIESFVLKTRPDSQGGIRLIRRSSLVELMEQQFKEQQTRPALMRVPGRKREAAILRGLADRLEGVDVPF